MRIGLLLAFIWATSFFCGAALAAPRLIDFSLPALDARKEALNLRRFEGKVTMLLLFEDQCSYCLSMIKNADALVRKEPERYQLVLIGVGNDANSLEAWSNRVSTTAEKVLADKVFISAIGGVKATPVLLIANAKGEFAEKITGAVMMKTLQAVLARVHRSN